MIQFILYVEMRRAESFRPSVRSGGPPKDGRKATDELSPATPPAEEFLLFCFSSLLPSRSSGRFEEKGPVQPLVDSPGPVALPAATGEPPVAPGMIVLLTHWLIILRLVATAGPRRVSRL